MTNKRQECWTNRTNTHTHTPPQLSISQDTEGWKEQKRETGKKRAPWTHQDACEPLLQLPRVRHGQFQGHVVSPEVGVLLHAPRVPHGSYSQQLFTPTPRRSLTLPLLPEKGGKESPRCEYKWGKIPPNVFKSVVFSPRRCTPCSLLHTHVREAEG